MLAAGEIFLKVMAIMEIYLIFEFCFEKFLTEFAEILQSGAVNRLDSQKKVPLSDPILESNNGTFGQVIHPFSTIF